MGIRIFNRATLCTALLLSTILFTRADYYYVKDLGALGGNTSLPGRVINDSGQIAAIGEISGRTHAVLLTPVLRKVGAQRSANDIIVTFDAIAGKTYHLESTATLSPPNWQSVPGVADITAATTGQSQFTQPNGATAGRVYYRVRML